MLLQARADREAVEQIFKVSYGFFPEADWHKALAKHSFPSGLLGSSFLNNDLILIYCAPDLAQPVCFPSLCSWTISALLLNLMNVLNSAPPSLGSVIYGYGLAFI